MSVLRSLFAWLLLGVLLSAMTLVLVALRIVVGDRHRRSAFGRSVIEGFVALYVRLSPLYRLRLCGLDHLPVGAVVLVANHESGIDAPCLMSLRRGARFIVASWLFRAPVIGFVMRAGDHIRVSSARPEDRRSTSPVDRATAALARGESVAVFPEGDYSEGTMKTFRTGAFVAARRSGAPVVPVRITGAGAAWRPGSWIVQGVNEITVEVLPPLAAEVVEELAPDALAQRVREQIAAA